MGAQKSKVAREVRHISLSETQTYSYLFQELSPELKQLVDEVFKIFDKDNSKTIEKDEAIKHWSKNFGKISA